MLKGKKTNLGPKLSYLGIFGLEFEKNISISEISTLEFIKNAFLTNTVNFDTFSQDQGSIFSEGLFGSRSTSQSMPSLLCYCLISRAVLQDVKLGITYQFFNQFFWSVRVFLRCFQSFHSNDFYLLHILTENFDSVLFYVRRFTLQM